VFRFRHWRRLGPGAVFINLAQHAGRRIAGVRVGDRCLCDTAAVYLRQGEEKTYSLIQTMGLPPRTRISSASRIIW